MGKVKIAALITGVLAAAALASTVHIYGVGNGALNAGVVVGPCGRIGNISLAYGYEWRGTPGFFASDPNEC